MIIEFKSKSLKKACVKKKKARRKYGNRVADKLIQRLYELQSFDNLEQVPHRPPFKRHKLKGAYSGCFSVNLVDGYRLIFKPAGNLNKENELDLKDVDKIKIWEVTDYHG